MVIFVGGWKKEVGGKKKRRRRRMYLFELLNYSRWWDLKGDKYESRGSK